MKVINAVVLAAALAGSGFGGPVPVHEVEAALGNALGFHIYRFETNLGNDEVLVVHEFAKTEQGVHEAEYATVGSNTHATYEIVLVDSGAFHPSLRNTYMLRFPNSEVAVKDKRLSAWGSALDQGGGTEFVFNDLVTNHVALTYRWSASLEKYSEVVKRWPDLPPPMSQSTRSSRRILPSTH